MYQTSHLRVPRWPRRGVPSCPSQGAIVCQVAHARCHCVPSCPSQAIACQVGHARCNYMPSCLSQGAIVCHVAYRKVLLRAYVAHRKPLCTKLPIIWYHRVAGCPSQGAIACQVDHCNGPLHAKLPIVGCHRVPCFPSQGAITCLRCPS